MKSWTKPLPLTKTMGNAAAYASAMVLSVPLMFGCDTTTATAAAEIIPSICPNSNAHHAAAITQLLPLSGKVLRRSRRRMPRRMLLLLLVMLERS